ncbi:MAG: TlpA family protein disulfide reductase [Betaproteobacteria bacterium]|nr:TlpA family protein disulfide reductase [Betaproteobacteria bacterium]
MAKSLRFWPAALTAAIIAAAAGYAVHKAFLSGTADNAALAQLTSSTLRDLSGDPRRLSEWNGKVLVVNFWATWCEPCRQEVPALVRIQSRFEANGLVIAGIAIDSVDKVREFSKQYGINYAVLVGGLDAIELIRGLGNRTGGLPFTLVLDRQGKLVTTHLGRISEAELEQAVKPLLK